MASQRLLILLIALLLSRCLSSDVPSPANFERRVNPRVGVINSQLYLEGGAVSEKGVSGAWPVNNTLSLDLTTSWLPQDASFRQEFE
ncbi:hypothetical protein V2G26_005008 [Clonostachys chloroleuca]